MAVGAIWKKPDFHRISQAKVSLSDVTLKSPVLLAPMGQNSQVKTQRIQWHGSIAMSLYPLFLLICKNTKHFILERGFPELF